MINTRHDKKTNRPVGIDLFAGAGGLSLGFEQAGFDIAAAVEIDVVFGGAPCQGFSMIGKRALDDSRNQLVFHYVRLVRELQPKYCVFENVKGLTVGKHAKFLEELIQALQSSGYDILLPYEVLNASEYGVPQQRHRLFLVGARKGEPPPSYPEALTSRIHVWDAIGDLPNSDDYPELEKSDSIRLNWDTKSPYARKLRDLDPDPDWFRFHITKWHGFRQIGNSVPPLLARALASEIITTLGISPCKSDCKRPAQDPKLLSFDMKTAARFFKVPYNTIAQRTRKNKTHQNQKELQLG